MRVAIVHDYLNQYGGAERVLEALHELFPEAPIFTIVYDKKVLPQYKNWDIRPSFVQKIPFAKQGYKNFIFFFPAAVKSFDLKGFDLVISNTHAWGKGVNLNGKTMHICYCLTPMRYIWDLYQDYLDHEYLSPFVRWLLPFWARRIRQWDIKTSKSVKYYIAISQTVARRIREYYRRESTVIYPPCDTDYFKPGAVGDRGYFLTVSRLKAYKRIDILVEAFNKLNLPLRIVGDGPQLRKLRQKAKRNIEFTGHLKDESLLDAYRGCKAFVFAGHEDFGLTMAEAQACGKPVVAFCAGGAEEIVIEGKTGLFFRQQTPPSLIQEINRFQNSAFDSNYIRQSSLKFSKERFKNALNNFISEKLSAPHS
ncbi:MAG: glycosyltransferase [Candidatus Omnitrophota bacterium]|nr:glycosyltransferase [Candidatus Omnitrophota bacterium]